MALLVAVFKPLAYLSLPYVLLASIAASSPTGRYYVRQGLYLGTMVSVAACSAVVATGMSLIGRRYDINHFVARTFYLITSTLLDIKVEVEGEEYLSTQPAVLMANHQTMLDVLVVGRLMPRRSTIMSKKSILYTPLGPFMSMAGAIFVDRFNNASAVASLRAAGERMHLHRLSLWIFPEGTRTSSEVPAMRELKKGGFYLALQAEAPIIPIIVGNYWNLYHKGIFDSGVIKVRVLPPISTTGFTPADIPVLATRVREQMLETLHDIYTDRLPEKEDRSSSHPSHSPSIPLPSPPHAASISGEPSPVQPSLRTESRASEFTLDSEPSAKGDDDSPLGTTTSSASLAASIVSSASGLGNETEEDEGMILVGRPV